MFLLCDHVVLFTISRWCTLQLMTRLRSTKFIACYCNAYCNTIEKETANTAKELVSAKINKDEPNVVNTCNTEAVTCCTSTSIITNSNNLYSITCCIYLVLVPYGWHSDIDAFIVVVSSWKDDFSPAEVSLLERKSIGLRNNHNRRQQPQHHQCLLINNHASRLRHNLWYQLHVDISIIHIEWTIRYGILNWPCHIDPIHMLKGSVS